MTIYILYSADYELFLGGNHCDEREVLIDPTNKVLDMCDSLKIPLTLFADIFSIIRYKEHNLFGFPDAAEHQLRDALKRGHDVQSHVHPHWKYTAIEGRRYTVDTRYFLLGNLDSDGGELYARILDILVTSRDYLHDLLREDTPGYRCIAFRSGGYGLQPNAQVVIRALRDAGFMIDSSIVPGLVIRNAINQVDYSRVPEMANYYLDDSLSSPSCRNDGIFEIPIASCTFSLGETLAAQIAVLSRYLNNALSGKGRQTREQDKGYPIQQKENLPGTMTPEHSKYYNFFKEFYYDRFYYLDCSTNDTKMVRCTKKYLKQSDYVKNDIFFSFNMHPKEMTAGHLTALKNYHDALNTYYRGNIRAISYQQAAEIITGRGFFP